jgi:hypothetical protein
MLRTLAFFLKPRACFAIRPARVFFSTTPEGIASGTNLTKTSCGCAAAEFSNGKHPALQNMQAMKHRTPQACAALAPPAADCDDDSGVVYLADEPAVPPLLKFSDTTPMVQCNGCKMYVPTIYTDLDHRRARFLGGPDVPENLQELCLWCHRAKSAYEQRRIAPIRRRVDAFATQLADDGIVGLVRSSNVVNQVMALLVPAFDVMAARRYAEQLPVSGNRQKNRSEAAAALSPVPRRKKKTAPQARSLVEKGAGGVVDPMSGSAVAQNRSRKRRNSHIKRGPK